MPPSDHQNRESLLRRRGVQMLTGRHPEHDRGRQLRVLRADGYARQGGQGRARPADGGLEDHQHLLEREGVVGPFRNGPQAERDQRQHVPGRDPALFVRRPGPAGLAGL